MRSRTLAVTIRVPVETVQAYASDPTHLPTWAPAFCRSVERVDERWVVASPDGPVVIAFAPPNPYGVLDHTVTLASGLSLTIPMRVLPNGAGSELLFTLFQHEGMSDAQFEADAALVRSDLDTLRRVLESEAR